jgi:hypothetical protein
MHQPTPDPHFSIYDDYKVHQPWLPSITGAPQRARMLVVGSQTSVPVLQRPYCTPATRCTIEYSTCICSPLLTA